MNSPRRLRNIASSICAAAFLCAATGVSAQTIYKVMNASGNTTFTDQPDLIPSPQSVTAPAFEGTRAAGRISPVSSRRAALIDANEAARRLGQAQLKRKQGMEPLPGEQAKDSGAGAVNHRYWRRQEQLRRVVEQAQRRLSETRVAQLVLQPQSRGTGG